MPVEEATVLAMLSDALEAGRIAGAQLRVVRAQSRRRSDLWFVGVRGEHGCRWVVKRPQTASVQDDLHPPMSSSQQLAALRRMSSHLAAEGGRITCPTPVAGLPDINAYAMEHVAGAHIAGLMTPAVVVAPGRLLAAMSTAAQVLQAVHRLPAAPSDVARPGTVDLQQVVLHGDFAPENVLLSGSGAAVLEPDLTHRGSPDVDVVRFLTMLYDAPVFVLGADQGVVQRVRRRAAAEFLATFYGPDGPSPGVANLLAESLAARWETRHKDCLRRRPALTSARLALLRRHFDAVLRETGDRGGVPVASVRPQV